MNNDAGPKPPKGSQRNLISSLERGFRVLRVFDEQAVHLTPAQVAKKTGLPRAVARRVLLTLCDLGYAVSDGKYFRLTPKVLDLAHGYLAKAHVRHLIDPILRATVSEINDSCLLAIRDGPDSITIACWNAAGFGSINLSPGLRVPLYVSTPGRLLLADLSLPQLTEYLDSVTPQAFTARTVTNKRALREEIGRIREQGFAVGREEFEPGVYAIAVALQTHSGATVAALTVVGNAAKIQSQASIDERIERLKLAAQRLRLILPEAPDLAAELPLSGGPAG